VIGCCVDLDVGEMTFYRNGVSMGVAFSGLRPMQHTLQAFFPAASLSYVEKCEVNFGALPFQHPVCV
jgi:Kip1 ubiquitination-promoting complex protein 1